MTIFKKGKYARRKRKLSPEHRQALIDSNTDKTVSEETRRKIGDANRGRLKGIPRPQWVRDKISASKKGMTFSKEWLGTLAASRASNGRITGATYKVSCLRCHLETVRWYFDGIHVHICHGTDHVFGPLRITKTPSGTFTDFLLDGIPYRFSSIEELVAEKFKIGNAVGGSFRVRESRWLYELSKAEVEVVEEDGSTFEPPQRPPKFRGRSSDRG